MSLKGQHRSNIAPSSQTISSHGKTGRTGELRRKLFKIYPLRFRPESALSRYSPVGNLGGNSEPRLRKSLSVHRKSSRLDSSPGHSFQ
jgi:hypothetical protein